jgi:hypothetical protein
MRSIAGVMIFDLLASQVAAFAGVRIQAGDGDARAIYAEPVRQVAKQDAQHGKQAIDRQRRRHRRQRQVRGCQRDAQRPMRGVPGQHHHDLWSRGIASRGTPCVQRTVSRRR